MPETPPGQPGYPTPPEPPSRQTGDWANPYGDPPAPVSEPDRPWPTGRPPWPDLDGWEQPPGQPASQDETQAKRPPAGSGWAAAMPPGQPSGARRRPPALDGGSRAGSPSHGDRRGNRGAPGYGNPDAPNYGRPGGPGYGGPGYGGPGPAGYGRPAAPGYAALHSNGPGYDASGGQPPAGPGRAPRGPRRGKARLVVSLVAVVCAVAAGAVYLVRGHDSGLPSAQGGSQSPGQGSHSPAPPVTHHGDLRNYLLAAPAGSQQWPNPLGTHRKLSLRQAASLSTDRKARLRTLTEDHFTKGAVQSWIKNGTWIDVRLYQFASAADAQVFFRGDIAASSQSTPAANQSPVRSVPGARAFADSKPDSDGYISVIAIGVKGDVVFLVDAAEHSSTAHLALPGKLMRGQYSKL